MRTRVWRFVEFLGERRAYLIVQPAWWKVEGRLLGADLGGDIFRRWVRCLVDGMYAT
jgi:hypothetical protein